MNLTRFQYWLPIWISIALLSGVFISAPSADVTIQTRLEKNVLRVGEQTQLEVVVTTQGEQISQKPAFPSIDGVNFVYGSQSTSQQFQFINGRASSSYQITFLYDVFAVKEGKYKVSDIRIATGAGTVQADPFEITVFPGSQPVPTRSPLLSAPQGQGDLNLYLLSDASKKEVYKGEEVILSYDAVYNQQWKRWFDRAIIQNGEYAAFQEEKGALKSFLSETVDMRFKQDARPVRISGERDLYFQKSLRRYILFPLTPGDYSLAPMTVEVALPIQRVSRYPYKPEPVQLKVKPLPEEGRPEIFEGAVGSFTLRAEAAPLELSEGETVTLSLTLEGIGNIKNAPKPALPDLSNFDQFDPTQKEDVNISENGMRGRIEYSYVLIPHDINANEIGPIQYAFFDPSKKEYVVRQTPPIRLTILPSTEKRTRTGSAVFNRRLITRVGDDFRFIATAPSGLATIRLPLYCSLKFWVIALWPILLLLLIGAWKWRHEFLAARPTVAKSLKAPKLARRFLADARKALERKDMESVYVKLRKAVTDYIDHRWNLTSAGMTRLELKHALQNGGVDESQADAVLSVLEEFDGARFSGAMQNPDRIQESFSKTEDLLSDLMKVKKAS
ncbi:MAG: protein BatD [Candidatus Omnitrophica bacterium]|nr:protein BatD [Candidatus Omnitrophota bacterium]